MMNLMYKFITLFTNKGPWFFFRRLGVKYTKHLRRPRILTFFFFFVARIKSNQKYRKPIAVSMANVPMSAILVSSVETINARVRIKTSIASNHTHSPRVPNVNCSLWNWLSLGCVSDRYNLNLYNGHSLFIILSLIIFFSWHPPFTFTLIIFELLYSLYYF